MLKTAGRYTKIINYVTVVLLYLLLVLQFLPFWSNGEFTTSIQEHVWWLKEKPKGPAITEYLVGQLGKDWKIDQIVLMPCVTIACAIITFFFGIKKPNRLWMNIVYMCAGFFGLAAYLGEPAFQLNSIYILHVVVCVLIIVSSVLNIALRPWKKIMHYMKYGE